MRRSLWINVAVLCLAIGAPSALADTITSGTLVFNLGSGSPTPTGGSFIFDNTTNQFLSFTATWDGITFDFSFGSSQTTYQALIGAIPASLTWTAACLPSTVNPTIPCDGLLAFNMNAGTFLGGTVQFPLPPPTQTTASAGGTLSVTGLATTIVPEPTTGGLVLLGMGLIVMMRKRILSSQSSRAT